MKREMTYSLFTDKGDRTVNEDSIGVCRNENSNLFVLCDGLGGHGMGDVASALVVDVFKDSFLRSNNIIKFLEDAFSASQEALMAEQKRCHAEKKMKTTATALVTDDKYTYIGHVGDSRAYVFSKNKVLCRTKDHSIPQMLVLSGEIKESEIRNHQDRNTLLRVMGIDWEAPMYELMRPIPKRKCKAFLLCSDGFWELIEEREMCDLLKKAKNADEWLEEMTKVVRSNGVGKNMDNYSAIAVWL